MWQHRLVRLKYKSPLGHFFCAAIRMVGFDTSLKPQRR